MRTRRTRASIRALLAMLTLATGALFVSPSPVGAQTNPFQRGPSPTHAALEAPAGPFAVATTVVPRQANFGGGTIYYPTDTSQGTFGAVAVSPGFLSPQFAIQWTGPRIASHGFVVFTLDTLTIFDFPGQRADQLQAALTYLTQQSTVRTRIDANRLGVMGHSMGGGGSLEATLDRPSIQASVPLQPWHLGVSFAGVRTPTLIVGAQNDFIAPVASHSEPFYTQIPATAEKAYVEVAGADHFLGISAQVTQAKLSVAWLKRYIDNDTRYEQFLCPPPSGPTIAEYRHTCPGS